MNKKPGSFLTVILVSAVLLSCQGPKLSTGKLHVFEDSQEMVAEAKAIIREIAVADFKNYYFGAEDVYLIDVRAETEFEGGNIDGAVLIPRGVLEFRIDHENFWSGQGTVPPQKDSEIILYCRSGNRSALAAKTLIQLGYKNVYALKGGWNSWIEIK
jgi:rhodanese-related sulfurtransferase